MLNAQKLSVPFRLDFISLFDLAIQSKVRKYAARCFNFAFDFSIFHTLFLTLFCWLYSHSTAPFDGTQTYQFVQSKRRWERNNPLKQLPRVWLSIKRWKSVEQTNIQAKAGRLWDLISLYDACTARKGNKKECRTATDKLSCFMRKSWKAKLSKIDRFVMKQRARAAIEGLFVQLLAATFPNLHHCGSGQRNNRDFFWSQLRNVHHENSTFHSVTMRSSARTFLNNHFESQQITHLWC